MIPEVTREGLYVACAIAVAWFLVGLALGLILRRTPAVERHGVVTRREGRRARRELARAGRAREEVRLQVQRREEEDRARGLKALGRARLGEGYASDTPAPARSPLHVGDEPRTTAMTLPQQMKETT